MTGTTLDRGADNAEAVRGGYAYVKMAMKAPGNAHLIHVEGTRRMYLCQCNRGTIWPMSPSKLGRGRRADDRWASNFRYRSWLRP